MNDRHWRECEIIREITRVACEQEAELDKSLTHTRLDQRSADKLLEEPCILLYAIHLTRLRQNGSFGAPRASVDPTEPFYLERDVERVKVLENERQLASEMSSYYAESKHIDDKQFYDAKLAEIEQALTQLNQAKPMSAQGIAMWDYLLANVVEFPPETYRRAREAIASPGQTMHSTEVADKIDYSVFEKATPPLNHKPEQWLSAGKIAGAKSERRSTDSLRKAIVHTSSNGLFMVDNEGRTARRDSPNGWWRYWTGNLTGLLKTTEKRKP